MSKEHHITPEEFDKMELNKKIRYIGYYAHNTLQHRSEFVINSMRTINAKDPGFVYTCICDNEFTLWKFGYTDEDVYNEADYKLDEFILESRKIDGDADKTLGYGIDTTNMSACQCPLDL